MAAILELIQTGAHHELHSASHLWQRCLYCVDQPQSPLMSPSQPPLQGQCVAPWLDLAENGTVFRIASVCGRQASRVTQLLKGASLVLLDWLVWVPGLAQSAITRQQQFSQIGTGCELACHASHLRLQLRRFQDARSARITLLALPRPFQLCAWSLGVSRICWIC